MNLRSLMRRASTLNKQLELPRSQRKRFTTLKHRGRKVGAFDKAKVLPTTKGAKAI